MNKTKIRQLINEYLAGKYPGMDLRQAYDLMIMSHKELSTEEVAFLLREDLL